jgi:alanine-synthesizing transaminase
LKNSLDETSAPQLFGQRLEDDGRRREDIIDLGMGNPDLPTPPHIVDKLIEAARNPRNHRYSVSRGIYKLRLAIVDWYKRRYDVDLDADGEAIATIGVKEGLSHLALSIIAPATACRAEPDLPDPPLLRRHRGRARSMSLTSDTDFFENLREVHAAHSREGRPGALLPAQPDDLGGGPLVLPAGDRLRRDERPARDPRSRLR